MAQYRIAVNMEFVRSHDLSFEAGVKAAAEIGYKWVEPMVHTGYELLSEFTTSIPSRWKRIRFS